MKPTLLISLTSMLVLAGTASWAQSVTVNSVTGTGNQTQIDYCLSNPRPSVKHTYTIQGEASELVTTSPVTVTISRKLLPSGSYVVISSYSANANASGKITNISASTTIKVVEWNACIEDELGVTHVITSPKNRVIKSKINGK